MIVGAALEGAAIVAVNESKKAFLEAFTLFVSQASVSRAMPVSSS